MSEKAQAGDVPAGADGAADEDTDASTPPAAPHASPPGTANGANIANGAGPHASPTIRGRHAAPDRDDRPRPRPRPAPADDYSDQFAVRFRKLVDATDTHDHPAAESPTATADAEATTAPDPDLESADPDAAAEAAVADHRVERRSGLIRSAAIIGIVLLAAVVLRIFVVGHYYIPSASMEPTLHGCPGCNDDHVVVDKVSYRAHPPEPGDIIVFDRPPGDVSGEKELIKRVIGVGGDTVALRNGRVYVNGLVLDEPYVNKRCGARPDLPLNGVTQWRIPRGDVFVMGDNRCNSFDSRAFGPIKNSSVVGRAFAIIWPLSRARLL